MTRLEEVRLAVAGWGTAWAGLTVPATGREPLGLTGEALAHARTASAMDLAGVSEGLAGLALMEGTAERAAFLLGVGVALRGTAVAGDPDVAGVASGAMEVIGAEAFAAAFAEGAALSRSEASAALF